MPARRTRPTSERLPEIQRAIEDCLDAFAIAKESVAYCLSEGGDLADGRLVTMLLTTSDVCRSASEILAIEAPILASTCRHTAEVCEYTAEECDRVGGGDEQLAATAEARRACADTCRRVGAVDFAGVDGRFSYS